MSIFETKNCHRGDPRTEKISKVVGQKRKDLYSGNYKGYKEVSNKALLDQFWNVVHAIMSYFRTIILVCPGMPGSQCAIFRKPPTKIKKSYF